LGYYQKLPATNVEYFDLKKRRFLMEDVVEIHEDIVKIQIDVPQIYNFIPFVGPKDEQRYEEALKRLKQYHEMAEARKI
jgi:hypothetical protein